LHQNVWQRVGGLCPDPTGVHEREGKKGGLTEGERWPQAWTEEVLTAPLNLREFMALYKFYFDYYFFDWLEPWSPRFISDRCHWSFHSGRHNI